ncbi:glycine receptor subunit alpha-3-like [Ornithodoros turicata]|uniref:glycine receptor subunit alpha-3-like n=1 Tax=Ornithodoros turicata TaxID=34597 RepID=UPI003138E544
MDFDMDMYLRQSWKDPRVNFRKFGVNRTVTLNGEHITSRLWKPDLFLANAKDVRTHSVTMANELVRITPDGDILFSIRLSTKLSCVMNFHNFPFDKQKCYAFFRSYAHPIHHTVLTWSDVEPVILQIPIEMQDFDLVRLAYTNFTTQLETGSFSTLRIGFIFDRQNGFHIIQTYLPTFIVVIVSWLALWIRPDFIPPRAIIGVKTVLTIASIIMTVSTHFPNVNYNKAIDVWMIACIVQVMGVLVEFGIANYLVRSKLSRVEQLKSLNPFRKTPWGPSKVSKNAERALKLDRLSRCMFPVLFMGFNIIYWSLYLTVPEPDLDVP